MKLPLLLVEDTSSLAMVYRSVLEKAGHSVVSCDTISQAREEMGRQKFSVILLDLSLPDGDGMELMGDILKGGAKVIVITANGSINRAIEAMREGAFDFLVKPFDEKKLLGAVENAMHMQAVAPSRPALEPLEPKTEFHGFLGTSEAMQQIYRMIGNIGRSSATVFITGESGTGKEVAAKAIHAVSARAKKPFVPLNCGAIPADLLESEVFGHLKGSFTGAIANKIGAAEVASGGTLFLDEICEMDLRLQTKLLRFLETSKIQPVGAVAAKLVDARILCATNRDPLEEVKAGRFREDLYYRLHVVPMHMPPLRARGEDINLIADAVLKRFAKEEGRDFERISPEVRRIFMQFGWPGNVRQLLNVLRNVVVLNNGITVLPEMLPAEIVGRTDGLAASMPIAAPDAYNGDDCDVGHFVGLTLAQFERAFVEATISECNGSVPEAARMLDVSPSTLYRKRESWRKAAR
ncbi:MAG: sigma-54-dependent Fis family transcriptional regulator [Rhodobacteraceae bacterium]|nr:sigma-54-dependent Fis family transcriptional regulator [Paracoccaceae bacterium]